MDHLRLGCTLWGGMVREACIRQNGILVMNFWRETKIALYFSEKGGRGSMAFQSFFKNSSILAGTGFPECPRKEAQSQLKVED